jgi:hypothetical protein
LLNCLWCRWRHDDRRALQYHGLRRRYLTVFTQATAPLGSFKATWGSSLVSDQQMTDLRKRPDIDLIGACQPASSDVRAISLRLVRSPRTRSVSKPRDREVHRDFDDHGRARRRTSPCRAGSYAGPERAALVLQAVEIPEELGTGIPGRHFNAALTCARNSTMPIPREVTDIKRVPKNRIRFLLLRSAAVGVSPWRSRPSIH